jgi:hypothetical protein
MNPPVWKNLGVILSDWAEVRRLPKRPFSYAQEIRKRLVRRGGLLWL